MGSVQVGWAITFALNFGLLIACDLGISALLVITGVGLRGAAAKLSLRVLFVADLFFLLSSLVLIAYAIHSRSLTYSEWVVVCLCLSSILTGIAGYYALDSVWRFASLAICLPGLVSLAMWYLKVRRMLV